MEDIRKEIEKLLEKYEQIKDTLGGMIFKRFKKENEYNKIVNLKLDFTIREALEKQKLKIEQNIPRLRELKDEIDELKAKIELGFLNKEFLITKLKMIRGFICKNTD